MTLFTKKFFYILKLQIILNIVLLIFNWLFFKRNRGIFSIFLILLIAAFIFCFLSAKDIYLKNIFNFINISSLPFIFITIYFQFFKNIAQLVGFPNNLILAVICLMGLLLLLVPITITNFGTVKNNFLRLMSVIWLIINLLYTKYPTLTQDPIVNAFGKSHLPFSLLFFIFTFIVVKCWGFKFCFNLKLCKKQFIPLIFVLLLSIWFAFFEVFLSLAQNMPELLWHWQFSLINPAMSATFSSITQVYFTAAEAGILEESARYIFILICLITFKGANKRLLLSILISSLIFALIHYFNYFGQKGTLSIATAHVISTFGIGWLLATIFLYSGKLWLSILLHAFIDFIFFSVTPLGMTDSALIITLDPSGYLRAFILALLPIIISLFFLCTKHRKMMLINADIIATIS